MRWPRRPLGVEIDNLGKPVGRQDQYAAAVGGINLIEFLPEGGGVRVNTIVHAPGALRRMHRSMALFYTGRQRSASSVLAAQNAAIESGEGKSLKSLTRMRDLAYEFRDAALPGGLRGARCACWTRTGTSSASLVGGITNPEIDDLYDRVKAAGALGAKLLGAGASGFLLVVAPPERLDGIRAKLPDLREVSFRFTSRGTHISLFDPPYGG